MKKTIFALLALSGVAAADVTIGSYITKDNANYDVVDTFAGKTKDQVSNEYAIALDKLHFRTLSFTLSTADMLVSDTSVKTGDSLTLKTLTILGRHDTDNYNATDSTMTVTLADGTAYTSTAAVWNRENGGCATITYNFSDNIAFDFGENLSFVFNRGSADGADTTYNLGIAPMTGAVGAPVVWNSVWQMGTQLTVATAATATVPEPTTATLSLLALAGLAARRRRK